MELDCSSVLLSSILSLMPVALTLLDPDRVLSIECQTLDQFPAAVKPLASLLTMSSSTFAFSGSFIRAQLKLSHSS